MNKEGELGPEELRAKEKAEADMEEDKARAAEAKAKQREAEARHPGDKIENLSPEEQGQVLGNLVAGYIKAGIPTQRAYILALQALNPDAIPQQPKATGEEEGIVKTVLQVVFDDFKERYKNPPVPPPTTPLAPPDPIAQMEQLARIQREMGETYMKQVYNLTAEDIAKLRNKPEGNAQLVNIGANLEQQLRLQEFQEDQRRKWAKFEADMEEWRAERHRKEQDYELSRTTKEGLGDGAKRLFDASAHALESISSRAKKEEIEKHAKRTGENPKCLDPECPGELAAEGAPEGYVVCTQCGRSYPLDEVS
ncbi:hypothetical protein ES703_81159 [subsurface metagenome]